MTISATYTPAQASGNGATVAFPFTFKTFDQADLVVIITDADDVDTTQTITTHYTVSLNADQNNNPGGTVTMLTAPASGETLTIARVIDALQETDIANGGGFYPEVLEDALDRLTMLSQQNSDAIDRSFSLPVTVAGVNTELPVPAANNIVGWNETADALQNYDPSVFATVVSFGTAKADIFDGDGVTLNFTLSANPGAQNNLDVSISGVTQTPGIDYTWTAGTTISFVVAPPSGTDNVLVRYMQGLANTNAQDAAYTPAGAIAVETTIKTKLREVVSAKDFGALGDGVTDDAAAIQAGLTYLGTLGGGVLHCPAGNYIIGAFTAVPADVTLQGDGMGATIFTHKTGLTGSGNLLYASGNRAKFKDFTIAGNSAGNSGFAFSEISVNAKTEVQIIGVEVLDWCRVGIDGLGTDCLIQNCRIIGNGATSIDGSGVQVNSTYGIWSAGSAGRLRIIGNTIRDTAYGPIYCGGRTVIVGNNITGGHWSYSPTGGGQIADGAAGCVIASGNYVGPGGGTVTSGFELNNESIITGNYIENQAVIGVALQASTGAGHNVTGNLIKRTGITGGPSDSYGIAVVGDVNDFVIANNTIVDDAGTPTMDYGIYVLAGTSDRYAITGNKIRNAQTADLLDLGTGTVKEVQGNIVTLAKGAAGTDGTSLNANAAGTTVAAGATSYVGIGAGSSFSATENLREQVISRAGRISRLSVKTTGAQPGGGSLVVTLRVNGVDTGLTVTFAAGAAAATQVDSTHTALVAAGDLVSLKFVNNDGGAVSATVGAFGCLLS